MAQPKDNWTQEAYSASASFVPELTSKLTYWLDPQPSDTILDLGCGDGILTAKIKSQCLRIIGLDASANLIDAPRRGTELAGVLIGMWSTVDTLRETRSLGPGGTFVFEMGGAGNVADVHTALLAALVHQAVSVEKARESCPWFFPSEKLMGQMLEEVGFKVEEMELEYRPTELTAEKGGGLEGWVRLMGANFLQVLEEKEKREAVVREVCDVLKTVLTHEEDGTTWLGYVIENQGQRTRSASLLMSNNERKGFNNVYYTSTSATFDVCGRLILPSGRIHGAQRLLCTSKSLHGMKRKAADSTAPITKRHKERESDYCDATPQHDENGTIIWPASPISMHAARSFLRECAASKQKTLIVPDKDADGLDAGVIILRTLVALGLPQEQVEVHLIGKNSTVHDEVERQAMQARDPKFVIVVDQGSRAAPPIVESMETKSLIIDHHLSDGFPLNAIICKDLHPDIASSCGFLCAMGTHGDLGNTLKWRPPFPDMTEVFKIHTKKAINDAVALINAPRRTAKFDVVSAWNALLKANGPKDVLNNPRLIEARQEINEEVEFRTHTPPKFSKDGKIAVLRIHSAAQVHGVIATRWVRRLKGCFILHAQYLQAGHLSSKALEIIMVANSGYRPGYVNFSCRVSRSARSRDPPVNIIESLKAAANLDQGDLVERMGESFARGHKEASGGIIPAPEFEELMVLMQIGEKPDPKPEEAAEAKTKASPQKNNLMNYFVKR
ncbi:MAG: hypothetical protein Q9217_004868 [Psora testacea]